MANVTQRPLAANFMQREIVAVAPGDTLKDALTLMTQNHVTGLPVVDRKSKCVGLITSSDILNYEEEHADDCSDGIAQYFDPDTQKWESVAVSAFGLEEFGDVSVSEVMTRDLIWVDRNTPLNEVAQQMVDRQVHRVLVMDEKSNLYGILSAFDFVRFVAESGN